MRVSLKNLMFIKYKQSCKRLYLDKLNYIIPELQSDPQALVDNMKIYINLIDDTVNVTGDR